MALLVIICGALLIVGGAISLLMGFDIVMTERGSAMTLGGTIALSGGVIAVGIGFALLRLSQILAALQERNVRGVRPVVAPDRPVVPLVSPESLATGDRPPPLDNEAGASRAGIGTGVIAAGIAASAAGLASGAMGSAAISQAGTSHDEMDTTPAPTAAVPDEDRTEIPAMSELPSPDTAPTIVVSSPPEGGMRDMEEELARALAEPGSSSLAIPVRKSAFSDSLSNLLAKPKSGKHSYGTEQVVDAERILGAHDDELTAVSGLEADRDLILVEPLLSESAAEAAAIAAATDGHTISPALAYEPGEIREPVTGDAAVEAMTIQPELAVAAMSEAAYSAGERPDSAPMVAAPSAHAIPSMKVLGTYNAGGRTYSMYADGSVQALTESGVERFSSMDELRRHLVRA